MRYLRKAAMALCAVILSGIAVGQGRFVENGRQWPEQVHFRAEIPGGRMYLEKGCFTYDLMDMQTVQSVFAAHAGLKDPLPPPPTLTCHAYKMHIEGMHAGALPSGKKAGSATYNFFLGDDRSKWSANLKAFDEVVYLNAYPGIDLKVYDNGNVKYDFIVKPGADAGLIALRYEGVKPKLNRQGEIELKTSVGTVTESRPFAYQYIEGQLKVVPCAYKLKDQLVHFEVGVYHPGYELIIDPELIFSTFSGSFADNFGYTATYDFQGHLYGGSSVFGNGYPVTTGSYQSNWAGGSGAGGLAGTDLAITKFSLDGTALIYSTYLGGSSDEVPNSLVTDSLGTLYILSTTSSPNFPVTAGAFQSAFAGGNPLLVTGLGVSFVNGTDIAVSRISADGTQLLASTFVGGTANDGVNTAGSLRYNYADEVRGEIEIDKQGNILVGSTTYSDNFPMLPESYQAVKNENQEGVLFKLNPGLSSLLAATYFGGDGHDAVYSVDVSAAGRILIGGGTTSQNLSLPADAYQPTYAGGQADGYMAEFDADLQNLMAATYYGSSAYDQIYFVEYNKAGFPHAFGQTRATGNTMILNAAYNVPNSGMLLAKFQPGLDVLEWSTVFGTGNNVPNLSPTAFSVDICNRIYLAGWGGSTNFQGSTTGLPTTPDALKSTTEGSDFYLMVLDTDASGLSYASFFGGTQSPEHVDGGTSRFDRTGKVYQAVCAGCGNTNSFPISPSDAWSSTNNSQNCNLGVAKIDFDLPLALASFTVEPVCLPAPAQITNTSNTFTGGMPSYQWNFGDGNTAVQANPTHTYAASGTYTIVLVVADPMSCNLVDTFSTTITVYPELQLEVPPLLTSCDSDTFEVIANTGGSAELYTWATNSTFTNIIQQGPADSILVYSTSTQTVIYIQIESGPCSLQLPVVLAPAPGLALTTGDTLLCNPDQIVVGAIFSGGSAIENIVWSPADAVQAGQGTQIVTLQSNEPYLLSISAISEYGCELEASIQIDVYPILLIAPGDTLACADEPIVLIAGSGGLATGYIWSTFPDFSQPLNDSLDSTVTIIPTSLTWYYIAVSNNGCTLTDSVAVSLLDIGTSIRPDQYICSGDTALIFVQNDFPGNQLSYAWEPDEFIISGQGTASVLAVINETTTFTVIVSTPEGCITEKSTLVTTSPLGNADIAAFANPPVITTGGSSEVSCIPVDDLYTYQWEPNTYLANPFSPQTTSTPAETITYTISIFDTHSNGVCTKSAEVTIVVYENICGEPNIFVPNAFTPNGDGENEVVYVRGNNITTLDFSIFNRWGEKVFQTDDQSIGWDGRYKGNPAEPAVFVYQLRAVCGDGQEYAAKGNITLIR